MGSRPVAWPLSLATKRCRMPKNTYSGSHPATFAQGLPKKRVFPGYPPTQQGTHMVPLQHPWVAPRRLAPVSGNEALPDAPKTPILGPTRPLSPKVSLKNEFSLGTHQAGRVPTWSLYNTHGVAPLRLAPFLGYTGSYPCSYIVTTPPPPTLVPTVSLKNEFSQDTHLPSRVPTWSLYNTHGVAPRRLAPVSGNEALPDAQKHLFWVPPGHFRQGLPKKRVFPGYPPGGSSTHMVSL